MKERFIKRHDAKIRMEKSVQRDIVNIISETIEAIDSRRYEELEKISNHTIHNASIFQDEYSVTIAVIVLSLSKIAKFRDGIENQIIFSLKEAGEFLRQNRVEDFCKSIVTVTEEIKKSDNGMRKYIQEAFQRAQIKKGTKIYSQGISLSRAAELLGLSQWELMQYVGRTNYPEDQYVMKDVKEKLAFTRKLFRKGQQ